MLIIKKAKDGKQAKQKLFAVKKEKRKSFFITESRKNAINGKFRYEDFVMEDIPNLMIDIWWYSDEHGTGCDTCTTYKKMCVQALKKKMEQFIQRRK